MVCRTNCTVLLCTELLLHESWIEQHAHKQGARVYCAMFSHMFSQRIGPTYAAQWPMHDGQWPHASCAMAPCMHNGPNAKLPYICAMVPRMCNGPNDLVFFGTVAFL